MNSFCFYLGIINIVIAVIPINNHYTTLDIVQGVFGVFLICVAFLTSEPKK